jgi:hypothetical protein
MRVGAIGWWRRIVVVAIAVMSSMGSLLSARRVDASPGARVGLVVDFGNGVVYRLPVALRGASATGLQVLQQGTSQVDAVGFGSLGAAVCSVSIGATHIGCPADASCLTCAQPAYWAYSRAIAGAAGFTASRAGAGATTVHDGDVEAWRWGSGAPPAFVAFDRFFPPAPTTTTRSATTSTPPPSQASTPPATVAPSRASTPPLVTTIAPGVGANSPSTPKVHPSSRRALPAAVGPTPTTAVFVDGKRAGARVAARRSGRAPGSSRFALVTVGFVVVLIIGSIIATRALRRRAATP